MTLEFSFKYKDYELRACPSRLVRLSPDDKNETIDLVKWYDYNGQRCCYSLAYFRKNDEGYYLNFVGSRPFDNIAPEDVKIIWSMLKQAQEILDEFFNEESEVS